MYQKRNDQVFQLSLTEIALILVFLLMLLLGWLTKAAQKDIAKMGKQIDNWSRRVVKSYAVAGAAAAVFAYKIGKDAVVAATNKLFTGDILINNLTPINGAVGDMSTQDITFTVNSVVTVADTGAF